MLMALLVPVANAPAAHAEVTCTSGHRALSVYNFDTGGMQTRDYKLKQGYIYDFCRDSNGPNYFVPQKWFVKYDGYDGASYCEVATANPENSYQIARFEFDPNGVGNYNPGRKTLNCTEAWDKSDSGDLTPNGVIFVTDSQDRKCFDGIVGLRKEYLNEYKTLTNSSPTACLTVP